LVLFFALPYSISKVHDINSNWNVRTGQYKKLSLLYVIFIATFVCYLLITYALKKVEAGVASYYIYVQPVITVIIGISLGRETFDILKVFSALLIL